MTINIEYILRKTMSWCPLKERMFLQVHESGQVYISNKNQAQANGGIANKVKIPLDMFDWRKFAIILALGFSAFILMFVNYLNRTTASYFGIILVYFTFIAFFNLSDKNKVSIDSEKLVIKTSFFESINILKHEIAEIKTNDNILYKYSWINLVLIILTLILGSFQFLALHEDIIRSADLEEAVLHIANSMFVFFIFISIFYRSNRRSLYPKTIRIETAKKNITLFPGNESEFDILKGELGR